MRHWLNNATWRLATVGLVLTLAASVSLGAAADKIRKQGGIGVEGTITGLDADGLVIQSVAGSPVTVALGDIARIIQCEKYPDLAKGDEAYAQGMGGKAEGFAEAERLFKGLLRENPPAWVRVLVQSRMYKLYGDAGRTPEALDAYLEIARNQPKLVATLRLPAPSAAGHDANVTMLKKVNDAIKATPPDKPFLVNLKDFKVALLMLEGSPEEVLPLIEPNVASQDEKVRNPAILKKVELLLALKKVDDASKQLDAGAAGMGEDYAGDVAYWRGRILQERGENLPAALEYMRLPILYPTDKARTADALCRAGQAMEAAKAPRDEVLKVLNEAVTKYVGTPGAERAKRTINELKPR